MKKIVPLAALLFFLIGCGQLDRDTNKIVIWHWMTDRHQTFVKLAQQYEEQTGIKVVFELYAPSDDYSKKIIAAAQARVLPDIFGILDKKKIFASFIESGFVADLTDALQANDGEWEKSLFAKALAVNKFEEGNIYHIKPGFYGIPLDVTNMQMLYNKRLLEKAGIDRPPRTFDEFLDAIESLRRVGIPGLVSGWGERWLIECFASNYAFNMMGEEKVMATFKGDVPYTDPDWIKVLNVFKVLTDHKALMEGIVTKGNKYAEQDFALERAAFAFNGSWCVNVYHKMNPDLEYGVMLPPRVNTLQPMKIWGGAGSSFVVNNSSAVKTKAIDFLKWITAQEQQVVLSRETKNLPANRHALGDLPDVLLEFSKGMEHTTHRAIWKYNEDNLVVESFVRGIQSIIIGEKDPQQVAQEVQSVKVKQMEKQRRRL